MKKGFFVLLILIFAARQSFAQGIPLHDALALQVVVESSPDRKFDASSPKINKILRSYFGDALNPAELDRRVGENPFIGPYFAVRGAAGISPLAGGIGLKSIVSSVGSLDVTNIADGVAKFLVKRTKQELNAAFFSRFYDVIKKPEYEDARLLFPYTYSTLTVIGDQIYNYEAYLNVLRESFEKDLNNLLVNLPKVIENDRYAPFFKSHPELKATFLSAMDIGNGLLNKETPGKIIADFDVSNLWGFAKVGAANNVKAAVQTLQLVSASLRSAGTENYWSTEDSVRQLINSPVAMQLYFGLLYEQARQADITFTTGKLTDLLKTHVLPVMNTSNQYAQFVLGFVKKAKLVDAGIKNLLAKEAGSRTFTDYYGYYNIALDLFEYTIEVPMLPGMPGITNKEELKKYLAAARVAGDLAMDINRKNYSSAVMDVYTIYNFCFGGEALVLESTIASTSSSAVQIKEAQQLIADRSKLLDGRTEKTKRFLLRYGSFMASIAQAENSDQVADAMEAMALPSGSSSIKRKTPFNVAINAYAGLFIGHESIQDIKDDRKFNAYGVTAPIGFTISRGHSIFFIGTGEKGWQEGKRGWSTSLFISLVDLGAIAAFRFKDDTTSQVPNIQLKHIFSPGAFISIGIPKCPLSVNFGAQMGPNLRKIDNGSSSQPSDDPDNKLYFRYSTSLTVDIPLLNLYTKPR